MTFNPLLADVSLELAPENDEHECSGDETGICRSCRDHAGICDECGLTECCSDKPMGYT